jgi:hypothetical protein
VETAEDLNVRARKNMNSDGGGAWGAEVLQAGGGGRGAWD